MKFFLLLEFEQKVVKVLRNKWQLAVGIFLFVELWFHISSRFLSGLKLKILSVYLLLILTKSEDNF